jgi:hypothetical protein
MLQLQFLCSRYQAMNFALIKESVERHPVLVWSNSIFQLISTRRHNVLRSAEILIHAVI